MTTTMSSTRNVRGIVSNHSLTAYTHNSTTRPPPFAAHGAVEKGVEVIDDLYGEALEIKDAGNTWLTYGPPMQLARVRYLSRPIGTISARNPPFVIIPAPSLRLQYFGMKDQIFDLIDQSALLPSQIKMMCEAVLGCANLPDPDVDPEAFIAAVDEQVALHPKVFDPPSGKMQPWIKTDVLRTRLKCK